ncbi:hypothetical protein B5807_11719 [Epicoccum nigrum]|uniref:Heterokaryon incompatibility domain-containing protein n=1 Tax=Epicoccum nigrum TaxID=105696 RepID=A0A1Y2LK95_EPING|nr:hypothetical protein B5807_11719 [Epicoccum nigrum]
MACRHPDIRVFDGLRCCLACGEAIFETRQPRLEPAQSSSGDLTEYEHDPLHIGLGQEIRLVILLPGESSDPIRCEIIHVLLGGTEFDAVSYTWATEKGDDSKSKVIQIGCGQSMQVTVNCEHALRQLRDQHTERHLWIDAICINQEDVNERSHQVGIMDQIFSTANCVIMFIPWEASTNFTSGYLFVEQLAPLFRWLHKPSQEIYTKNKKDVERALNVLLRSRYFQRAWVIQEIALAKKLRLRWETYEAEIFFPIIDQIRQGYEPPPALNWSPGLARHSDIISCLQAGFKCKAKDRRDRIFAVLSLMEPSSRSLIPVDYTLSVQSVYSHAAVAVVASLQNLGLLTYITSLGEDLISLSSKEFEEFVLSHESDKYQSPHRLRPGNHPWKAHSKIKVLQEPNIGLSTDLHRGGLDDASHSCYITANSCSIYGYANVMPQFHVRAHFIDTILRDRNWTGDTKVYRIFQGSWFRKYFSLISRMEDMIESNRIDNIPQELGEWTNESDLQAFEKSFDLSPGHARGRQLFETQYSVGHVPRELPKLHFSSVSFREGDAIFAVDGVSTPLILREIRPGEYRIVTECYLWAALELDYWNPGTKKGRWGTRHYDHGCDQTRMITIV